MAGADLPLELLPGKLQQTPSRKEDVPLGAAITFQLDFELIGQPAVPANKADSFPAPRLCSNGRASVGIIGQGHPGFKCEDKEGKEARASLISACIMARFSPGVVLFTGNSRPVQGDVGPGWAGLNPVGFCSSCHQCFPTPSPKPWQYCPAVQ